MPKSKHRRKPGAKAVAHPGRSPVHAGAGRSVALNVDWQPERVAGVDDLPLFEWTDSADAEFERIKAEGPTRD